MPILRQTPSQQSLTSSPSSSAKSTSSDAPVIRGRRHPDPAAVKPSARFAEVAGGTAAECAAVVCCPCGILGMVVYAAVKIPAGLCRRAIVRGRRKKRRVPVTTRRMSALMTGATVGPRGYDDVDEWLGGGMMRKEEVEDTWMFIAASAPLPEAVEMEKEMWASFYGTGFWRSPSRREDP